MTPSNSKLLKQLKNAAERVNMAAKKILNNKTEASVLWDEYKESIMALDSLIKEHPQFNHEIAQAQDTTLYKDIILLENKLFDIVETNQINSSSMPNIKRKIEEIEMYTQAIKLFYDEFDNLTDSDLKGIWSVRTDDDLFPREPQRQNLHSTNSVSSDSTNSNSPELQQRRGAGHYPFRILKTLLNKFTKVRDKTDDRLPLLPRAEENPKPNKRKPN